MLFKILIFSLLAWWLYSWYRWSQFKNKARTMFGRQSQSYQQIQTEDLISCPSCHTYFPSSKSVKKKGQLFCSEECAKKFNS